MPETPPSKTAADHLERLAAGALLLTPVLPLVFAPGVIFPYVTIRAVLFRALVLAAAWCAASILLLRRTSAGWRADLTALALGAVFATSAISAFAGPATWHSWFGDFERMGGVVTWLALLAYCLLLLRFLDRDTWRGFLQIAAAAGALAAVFAWFQYYGAFTGIGLPARTHTSSTIGNPGLFAPFVAFTTAFSLLLAVEAGTRGRRALYVGLAVTSATGIWFAQNRSTVVGIAIAAVIAMLAYLYFTGWPRRRLLAVTVIGLLVIAGSVAALRVAVRAELHPQLPGVTARLASAAAVGEPLRIVQWRATWRGFTQRPALGWGPENQHLIWSANYDPAMYGLDPLSRWDRAHNAYLEALATTGIPGALATLALWIAIFVTIFRARARGGLSPPAAAILIGINVVYAVFLFFWFYDVNSTMLWIAAAAFASSRALETTRAPASNTHAPPDSAQPPQPQSMDADRAHGQPGWRTPVLLAATSIAAIAVLYVHAFETLRAARAIERLAASPPPLSRGIEHLRTLGRSPAPQSLELFTEASTYLAAALRPDTAAGARPLAPPEIRREAVAITLGLGERELRRDPRNERVALHAARVALLGAGVYEDPSLYDLAVQLGERAVSLNPRNVQVRLVLANFYLLGRDRARAERQFVEAARVFPDYAEPQRAAVRGYAAVGMYGDAARWLRAAQQREITVEPRTVTRVTRALHETGFAVEALALLRRHVLLRLGPAGFWSSTVVPPGVTLTDEIEQAELLATLAREQGRVEEARATAAAIEQICPRRPCDSLVPLNAVGALPFAR